MDNTEYELVLKLAVDNAEDMLSEDGVTWKRHDEDEFHRVLFDRVLVDVDNDADLSHLDAREVSEVCGDVESDIFHGDIIGLDRYLED